MDALIRQERQLRGNDGGERGQETRDSKPAYDCMNPVNKERETMTRELYTGPLMMVQNR
jgi:hypothetical protein